MPMIHRTIPAWLLAASLALALSLAAPTRADIIPIGPFTGALSENFDNLGLTGAQQQVAIMGGAATMRNLTTGGALKIEFSSSLNGVLVTPRSPPLMMGMLGISEWVFNTPLSQFGSYFQNNSRFDDATVAFYDVNDGLIGTENATVPHATPNWTWNGWQSTVPIHRLVITGNDVAFLNGFIWFDDVQANTAAIAVPEPSPLALAGAATAFCVLAYIQRRRATKRVYLACSAE
jgi:hypothetical protein